MAFRIKSKALIFLAVNIFLAGLYISLNSFSNRILLSSNGTERTLKTLEKVALEENVTNSNNSLIPPEYFLIQKLSETAKQQTIQDSSNNDTFTIEGNQYHYDQNPFRKLGLYQEIPDEYYNFKSGGKLIKGASYYRIKHKKNYCDQVDLYNLYNPSNLFNNMNFITDYSEDESLIREEVMKKIGNDVMPGVEMSATESHKAIYDMAVNATMMFFKRSVIHSVYEINKEWACILKCTTTFQELELSPEKIFSLKQSRNTQKNIRIVLIASIQYFLKLIVFMMNKNVNNLYL